jgi:hypothetical protein
MRLVTRERGDNREGSRMWLFLSAEEEECTGVEGNINMSRF